MGGLGGRSQRIGEAGEAIQRIDAGPCQFDQLGLVRGQPAWLARIGEKGDRRQGADKDDLGRLTDKIRPHFTKIG